MARTSSQKRKILKKVLDIPAIPEKVEIVLKMKSKNSTT